VKKPETISDPAKGPKKALMNLDSPWTVYRTRFLVRARQLTKPLVFTDPLGREQSGHSGDYLVESSDGITRIITQRLFKDIYVPMSQSNMTQSNMSQSNITQSNDAAPGVLARSLSRASPPVRAHATA
jgi:hypothetical protein